MLRTVARRARKALTLPRYYGGGLFKVFSTAPVFLWAQAVAFKTFVTLLPLLVLATGIFGLVVSKEESFTTVSGFLRAFLPQSQSDGLVELMLALQGASVDITVFGAAAFLFTVITLFATLRYVVGAAMGESRHRMRKIVGGYLFDLRMMAQVGSLFLLSFAITGGTRVVSARSGALASNLGLDAAAVSAVTSGMLHLVTLVVPYILTVGMLAQLYYFVPRPHPPWRAATWGAASAALLFEIAKNGFALYATHVADFDQYADQAEGLGGVFGLILAFVFWVYLSGLILIVGAVVASLYEKRHRPRRSRLRSLWSRMGSLRRHRERFEAEAVETAARPDPTASTETAPDAGSAAPDSARLGPEAEDPGPAEGRPAGGRPAEIHPVEASLAEARSAEGSPAEGRPAEGSPVAPSESPGPEASGLAEVPRVAEPPASGQAGGDGAIGADAVAPSP